MQPCVYIYNLKYVKRVYKNSLSALHLIILLSRKNNWDIEEIFHMGDVQCLAKVFIPLHFCHLLLSCRLEALLNYFKLLFPHINSHSIHHNDKAKKQTCDNFANVLKIKHWNKYIALVFIPLTQYLVEAHLQPQVFLGMMRQALHICIWQLSAILRLTSSPLSAWMGAGRHFQVSPKIFYCVHLNILVH